MCVFHMWSAATTFQVSFNAALNACAATGEAQRDWVSIIGYQVTNHL